MFEKPKNIFLVGLTGGIASGKSLTAKHLKESGFTVIDVDELLRELTSKGQPLYHRIVEVFGEGVLSDNGEIERKLLAEIIFNNEEKRRLLEANTHPVLFETIGRRLEVISRECFCNASGKTTLYECEKYPVVIEAPLLFETGADRLMDMTIVVSCSADEQIERLIKRDRLSRTDAERRVSSQMPLFMKESRADVVVVNSGSPDYLALQAKNLIKIIISSCKGDAPLKRTPKI